jgi:hypothetical protein
MIEKTNWIDYSWKYGSMNTSEIYLMHFGSNSCYKGFNSVEEAKTFRLTLDNPEMWRVHDKV